VPERAIEDRGSLHAIARHEMVIRIEALDEMIGAL